MMKQPAQSASIIIKKYANRRLYDTAQSAYITLADLAMMVQSGKKVKIIDAKTGADLTAATLLQILADKHNEGTRLISVEALRLLLSSDKPAPALSAHITSALKDFTQASQDEDKTADSLTEMQQALESFTAAFTKFQR